MRLHISKVPKESNHTATNTYSTINLTGEILFLPKVLVVFVVVVITFGKYFYSVQSIVKFLKFEMNPQ